MKKILPILSILALGASANSITSVLTHQNTNLENSILVNQKNKDVQEALKLVTDVAKNTTIDGHNFKAGDYFYKNGVSELVLPVIREVIDKAKEIAINSGLESVVKIFNQGFIISLPAEFQLQKGDNLISFRFRFQADPEIIDYLVLNLTNVKS